MKINGMAFGLIMYGIDLSLRLHIPQVCNY
jgi:hypothetical protein